MASARKCDRCERCFDPAKMTGMACRLRNPYFQTANDAREGVIGKLMLNGKGDNLDTYLDLCPECAEMFEAFMCGAEPPAKKNSESPEEQPYMFDIFKTMFGIREEGNDG